MKRYIVLAVLPALALGLSACAADSDDGSPTDGGGDPIVNHYAGSASEGDLVTFEIDKTNKTYVATNETTGGSSSGSYSTMTGELQGVYEVTADGDRFFAVELDDKILAANFPTGNAANDLSYGVSAEIDNNGKVAQIAGDYIWIRIANDEVNGSVLNKEWGALTVASDGNWYKRNYTGDAASPMDVDPEFPLTGGDESGTWTVDDANKERLVVTVDGSTETLTGFAYASQNEAAFLLDLGTGEGFMLGVENSSVSQATIAGTYKFVDAWANGGRGAGNATIPASGDGTFYHKNDDGTIVSGTLTTITQSPYFSNTFECRATEIQADLYLVVMGDIMLHFMFDDNGFVSYGAGAKL